MTVSSNRVAVVGAGQTAFGVLPHAPRSLLRQALLEAVASVDKGISPSDVGEGYLATLGFGGWQIGNPATLLAEEMGRPGIPVTHVENACASGSTGLRAAYHALRAGSCDVAVVAGLEKMTDDPSPRRRFWLGVSGETEWERLAGLTFAGVYALLAERYLSERKLTPEVLGAVAVKNHAHGALNPHAHLRKPITLEKHRDAPPVADPLKLYDCCPVSDGAAAVLLAREEVARRFTDTPIWIDGSGGGSDFLALQDRPSLTSLAASRFAADQAFAHAPFPREKVQFAEVHDCFTIAELLALEDTGLLPKGEAPSATMEGRTRLGGALPINPSGGLKAKGHPLGATGVGQVCEIYHQLRGEAGPRQVPGAERALAHNVGGSGATAMVHVFSR
ncbi:MAG: thiolase domain-containing protein [Euryarchaeota archaeon]|nr:thiolase domain-containing protein [Euryarchaeota archaeon]